MVCNARKLILGEQFFLAEISPTIGVSMDIYLQRDDKKKIVTNSDLFPSMPKLSVSKYFVCCIKIVYIVYPKYLMTAGKVSFITFLPNMFLFHPEPKAICV